MGSVHIFYEGFVIELSDWEWSVSGCVFNVYIRKERDKESESAWARSFVIN